MSQVFSKLHRSFRFLAPLLAALALSACVCTMAPKAAALKPTADTLLEASKKDSFAQHQSEVQSLAARFQADLDAVKTKAACAPRAAEYRIWSNRILLTLNRWKTKNPNPLNPVFVDEQISVINSEFSKVK